MVERLKHLSSYAVFKMSRSFTRTSNWIFIFIDRWWASLWKFLFKGFINSVFETKQSTTMHWKSKSVVKIMNGRELRGLLPQTPRKANRSIKKTSQVASLMALCESDRSLGFETPPQRFSVELSSGDKFNWVSLQLLPCCVLLCNLLNLRFNATSIDRE